MDFLVFIGVIGCLVLVAGWYVLNAGSDAEGEKGLLAFRAPSPDEAAPSYREKPRRKARPALRPEKEVGPVFRGAFRGYRAKTDDARFRTKGPLPRPAHATDRDAPED